MQGSFSKPASVGTEHCRGYRRPGASNRLEISNPNDGYGRQIDRLKEARVHCLKGFGDPWWFGCRQGELTTASLVVVPTRRTPKHNQHSSFESKPSVGWKREVALKWAIT